jgi:hypothetical protein
VRTREHMKINATYIIKFLTLISLMLSVHSITVHAQIYKSVDENGVVTFSDVPPGGGSGTHSLVRTNPTNSMPPVTTQTPETQVNVIEVTVPYAISISSPGDNTTIPMGAGIFDVTAEPTPPLSEGEMVALYLDGEMVGTPQTDTVWTLTYVIRGAHTLQVRRLSSSGGTISESDLVTVFVLRPSVLKGAPR